MRTSRSRIRSGLRPPLSEWSPSIPKVLKREKRRINWCNSGRRDNDMRVRTFVSGSATWVLVASTVLLNGCAKHADFMDMRNQLSTISRTQDQDHQRVDAAMRRLEAVERSKD